MSNMVKAIKLPVVKTNQQIEALRQEVRAFIKEEMNNNTFQPQADSWLSSFSAEFTRKLGEKGWLGVTIPKEYGGQGGSI